MITGNRLGKVPVPEGSCKVQRKTVTAWRSWPIRRKQ